MAEGRGHGGQPLPPPLARAQGHGGGGVRGPPSRGVGGADQIQALPAAAARRGRALKNSYDGLTFFAPNDNAFTKLKTGTLNGLTDQQKIQLLLYHVLPRYYSVTTFQTASNLLPTEASGPGGMYSVNVTTTTTSHRVNMSTGVPSAPTSSRSGTLLAPASSKRPARLPGRV